MLYWFNSRSNDLYILDIKTMRWRHPLETENTPNGRQRHTACVIGIIHLSNSNQVSMS